jgi:hypothetical protein
LTLYLNRRVKLEGRRQIARDQGLQHLGCASLVWDVDEVNSRLVFDDSMAKWVMFPIPLDP